MRPGLKPGSIGAYIEDHTARTAPTFRGEIVTKFSAGDYSVKVEHTGNPVRASRSNITDEYEVGQIVQLTRGDGSGRNRNTEFIISGLANTTSRNASANLGYGSVPAQSAESLGLILVDGDPAQTCELVAGGVVRDVFIVGVNLSKALVYGNAGIVDNAAQAIAPTSIEAAVKANGGTPPGRYSLTVAGQVLSKFFVVRA